LDSDIELLDRIGSGDDKAFDMLVERYREMVYLLAYRMAGHQEIALDISQEVWIKVFKSLGRFRRESAFKTWLYRLATNQAITHLRKLGRQGGKLPPAEEPLQEPGVALDGVMVSDKYELEAEPDPGLKEAIKRAIEQLPPKQRAVFVLKFYRGLRHEEIASMLNRSVGAVKANYFHALKKLAIYLEPYKDTID
jgi:RNA polymerase sigma-70 factor (ECF subfamily)